jgi:hypothetical protein
MPYNRRSVVGGKVHALGGGRAKEAFIEGRDWFGGVGDAGVGGEEGEGAVLVEKNR